MAEGCKCGKGPRDHPRDVWQYNCEEVIDVANAESNTTGDYQAQSVDNCRAATTALIEAIHKYEQAVAALQQTLGRAEEAGVHPALLDRAEAYIRGAYSQ